MIKMSYNRCKDIHKFGNKYLPSAYKAQVEFRSHFSGKSASYGPRHTVYCKNVPYNIKIFLLLLLLFLLLLLLLLLVVYLTMLTVALRA